MIRMMISAATSQPTVTLHNQGSAQEIAEIGLEDQHIMIAVKAEAMDSIWKQWAILRHFTTEHSCQHGTTCSPPQEGRRAEH